MMPWILTAILWFGIASLRAPGRWWLTGFELAIFALALAAIARRTFVVNVHPVGAFLAGAAGWALVQGFTGISVDPQKSFEAALGWVVSATAFSLGLMLVSGARRLRTFLMAQALFSCGIAVLAVVWLYAAGELGPFAYRNQFAAFLEPSIGIAVMFALFGDQAGGRERERESFLSPMVWAILAAAMFACVVAGGSRAGSILALAEIIVIPVVAFARGRVAAGPLLRTAVLSLAGAAVLVGVVGWDTIWKRLQEPNPYSLRADLVRSSLKMVQDRPLSGTGLGTWAVAYPGYATYDDGTFVNQAHNDWAQWAVEGGVLFLLAMLLMFGMVARSATVELWGIGLVTVFLHALVDYPFQQRPALAAYFFCLVGVLLGGAKAMPVRAVVGTRARSIGRT
jgi:O-antigen ligase